MPWLPQSEAVKMPFIGLERALEGNQGGQQIPDIMVIFTYINTVRENAPRYDLPINIPCNMYIGRFVNSGRSI
jgi:hypothetical protein